MLDDIIATDVGVEIIDSFSSHPNWGFILQFAKESKYEDMDDLNDKERSIRIAELIGKTSSLISYGGFRAVFSVGEYIVKVPTDPEGFHQNMNEYSLWKEGKPAIRKHMVPGAEGGKDCLVLCKADVFQCEEDMVPYLEQIENIHADFASCGLRLEDCEPDRYDQYGLYKGRLVVLDLGECYTI